MPFDAQVVQKRYYSVSETATYLSLSRASVFRLIRSGQIPASIAPSNGEGIRKTLRVDRVWLDSFMKSSFVSAPGKSFFNPEASGSKRDVRNRAERGRDRTRSHREIDGSAPHPRKEINNEEN